MSDLPKTLEFNEEQKQKLKDLFARKKALVLEPLYITYYEDFTIVGLKYQNVVIEEVIFSRDKTQVVTQLVNRLRKYNQRNTLDQVLRRIK